MLTTPENQKLLQFAGIVTQANLETGFALLTDAPVPLWDVYPGTVEFDNTLCAALSKRANTKRPFAGFTGRSDASAIHDDRL